MCQARKIQYSPVKYGAEKGYYFLRRLSKISSYSNLGQTLLFLVQHGSANKNGSCWRIILLQGRSPGRIRGRANTPLSGGKNGWLSSTSLAQADGWGGGMGMMEGRGKGKHDLAPMVSTGAHAKGNPPTSTTTQPAQIHMGHAGGCVGNRNQGVKRMIIPVPSR